MKMGLKHRFKTKIDLEIMLNECIRHKAINLRKSTNRHRSSIAVIQRQLRENRKLLGFYNPVVLVSLHLGSAILFSVKGQADNTYFRFCGP